MISQTSPNKSNRYNSRTIPVELLQKHTTEFQTLKRDMGTTPPDGDAFSLKLFITLEMCPGEQLSASKTRGFYPPKSYHNSPLAASRVSTTCLKVRFLWRGTRGAVCKWSPDSRGCFTTPGLNRISTRNRPGSSISWPGDRVKCLMHFKVRLHQQQYCVRIGKAVV